MRTAISRISRGEFNNFLKGKYTTVYNQLGTIKYNLSDNKAISIVVSSKHEKSAVIRNKLKRRIFNTIKQTYPNITAIFYTSKQSYNMNYDEIKKYLNDLLSKITKNT